MNPLKFFRKSKFIMVSGILFMVFSCSQYELNKTRNFNYAVYDQFKKSNLDYLTLNNSNLSTRTATLDEVKTFLENANIQYDTNIEIPSDILEAMGKFETEAEIQSFILDKNLLDFKEITVLDNFITNLKTEEFSIAINKLESEVNSLNLNDHQFKRFNDMANAIKILNDKNPDLLDNQAARDGWACAWATVMWIASLIALVAGCATVFLCVLGVLAFATATVDYIMTCCPEPGDC